MRRNGFTLIELMLVIAIIAIVASFAIPLLQNARLAANEGSAIASLRSLSSANQTYRTRFGAYASSLTDLNDSAYIDDVLGGAAVDPGKAGYVFTYTGGTNSWSCNADPLSASVTGSRHFFVDTSGVIRYSEGAAADASDPPVAN